MICIIIYVLDTLNLTHVLFDVSFKWVRNKGVNDMFWLYWILGGIAFCLILYGVLSFHAGILFGLAEIDMYDAISFELTLKEVVIEKLLNNKSLHIQRFLSAPIFSLVGFLHRINLNEKESKKIILEVFLLGKMQQSGRIEVTQESLTKEDLLTRLFLLDGLDDVDRKGYQDFIEGKDEKINRLKKVTNNLEEIAKRLKDLGNKEDEDFLILVKSLQEEVNKIELTFIRKKPGGKRPPKRSFKPFFNPRPVFN